MSAATVTSAHADGHHGASPLRFGFLVYIMSDLILFSTLFATFAVFGSSFANGPKAQEFIELNFVLVETSLLLLSSITYGFAMVQVAKNNIGGVKMWLGITFLLGLGFIGMEVYEFHHLITATHDGAYAGVMYWEPLAFAGVDPVTGNNLTGAWVLSAHWSSFFMLVGTHGLHVTTGLIWMLVMFIHLGRNGLSEDNKTRLSCLSLFWHFLDIVWVGVFTTVYLMGAI